MSPDRNDIAPARGCEPSIASLSNQARAPAFAGDERGFVDIEACSTCPRARVVAARRDVGRHDGRDEAMPMVAWRPDGVSQDMAATRTSRRVLTLVTLLTAVTAGSWLMCSCDTPMPASVGVIAV